MQSPGRTQVPGEPVRLSPAAARRRRDRAAGDRARGLIARESFALSDPLLGGNVGGFTWDNYTKLLDPVYAKTMTYSLAMAALNAVVCLVVGYAVAFYIATRPASRQPVLLMLVIIPFLTDFLVRTFAWITLLGRGGPT